VRLVEVARDGGAGAAYLVDDASALRPEWLEGVSTVGLTSGASVPEDLVDGILARLADSGFDQVEEVEAVPERMQFALPHELRREQASRAKQPTPAFRPGTRRV
jgi:4-hydroxy-3-methylbut-2-enyl diphosphate reductase